LLGAGYSLNEIADATFEADTIKRSRAETNRQQKWDGVHAMMELTGRNMRKLLGQNRSQSQSTGMITTTTMNNDFNASSSSPSSTKKSKSTTPPQRRGSVKRGDVSQTKIVSPSA
jgi:hypothetical protein